MATRNEEYTDMTVMLIDVEMKLFTIKTQAMSMHERLKNVDKAFTDLIESINGVMSSTEALQNVLQVRRNEVVQETHNAIDILGLPEGTAENKAAVAQTLSRIMHFHVGEDKILSCEREAGVETASHGLMNCGTSPPKTMVVYLADREIRDRILNVAKSMPLHFHGAGSLDTVTITEHLTFMNQRLLVKAREVAALNDIKFVWVENGAIFVRRHELSRVHRIRSAADVEMMPEFVD